MKQHLAAWFESIGTVRSAARLALSPKNLSDSSLPRAGAEPVYIWPPKLPAAMVDAGNLAAAAAGAATDTTARNGQVCNESEAHYIEHLESGLHVTPRIVESKI